MKKIVSLILISLVIVTISTVAFASSPVLGDDNTTTITGNQYQDAQKNTQNNETTLPQTGVDYSVVALLVIFAGSAVFALKKVSEYRDIK